MSTQVLLREVLELPLTVKDNNFMITAHPDPGGLPGTTQVDPRASETTNAQPTQTLRL